MLLLELMEKVGRIFKVLREAVLTQNVTLRDAVLNHFSVAQLLLGECSEIANEKAVRDYSDQ